MSQNEDLIFAELAMKNGLLTPEQVDELLDMQAKLEGMGLSESIADLATKKNMLSGKDANLLRMKVSPRGGGHQIEGYRLVCRLGRGGMGAVYKAVQLSMDRPVAIKVLKPSLVQDDQQVARLKREAQLIGRLQHPNIVKGLDFGVSNGFHYFAMEYVEGQSVRSILDADGPMSEVEALRIVRDITGALQHAHQEGVVHRDIKPGNILIGKNGEVKLADYGLAKGPLEDHQLTQSGVTVGTPQYISPEQARGPSEVDIRSDLYSLGATLYHMVTGRPPFQGQTLAHLIQQVLYERYAPPRTLRRDLSPDVDFLIEKMMARQPRHRYQNPAELLADLDAIEASRSIVPTGWQGDFEVYHEKKRLKKLIVALIVVLVVAILSGAYWTITLNRIEEEKQESNSRIALGILLDTSLTRENIDQQIRDARELIDRYQGREAAFDAEEYLDRLLRERIHLDNQNKLRLMVSDLREKDGWAAALRAIEQHRARLPAEGADLGRKEADDFLVEVSLDRDAWVADRITSELEELIDRKPRDARDALELLLETLERNSYTESEDRRGLAETAALEANLSQAIDRIDGFLYGPNQLLSGEDQRNYREIRESLAVALRDFRADAEMERILAGLPRSWAMDLTRELVDFDAEIVDANFAEEEQVALDAAMLQAGGKFEGALQLYQDLADRSVREVSEQLASKQRDLSDQQQALQSSVEEIWKEFLPPFAHHLSRREWALALLLVNSRQPMMSMLDPNPKQRQMASAELCVHFGSGLEGDFLSKVNGKDMIPGGLKFGAVNYPEVFDVTTDARARTLTFRAGGTGGTVTLPVSQLAPRDLMRFVAREQPEPLASVLSGLLEWGDLKTRNDPRQMHEGLPGVLEQILSPPAKAAHPEFVAELAELIRGEQTRVGEEIAALEEEARKIYNRAYDAFELRNYPDAYSAFDQLLTSPRFSKTDFVRKRKEDITSYRDQAKEKLPTVKMTEFYGMRWDHVSGSSVRSQDYVATGLLDVEDPLELTRWEFTPGRVGIVQVESPPVGPPAPWEAPDSDRIVVEHRLRFYQPEKEGDELDLHPLRFETPFIYSRHASVEFRVRWDRPVAMMVSLCGTNVVVLSDTSRIENGRGVHIWQGTDLSRPDLEVPREFRTTWLQRNPQALTGEDIHHRYFQFEAGRWYRVRFVKGEKLAELYVDDRLILEKKIQQYAAKGRDVVFRTWTPCELDEMRVLGHVDGAYYDSIPRRLKEEAQR